MRQQQAAQRQKPQARLQASKPALSQPARPRVELFRGDAFASAPSRAPVQLRADVRASGVQTGDVLAPRASGLRAGNELASLTRGSLAGNDLALLTRGSRAGNDLALMSFRTQPSGVTGPLAFTGGTSSVASARFDDSKVTDAYNRVLDAGSAGGTVLADQLRDEDLSVEDRRELIDRVINGGNAGELLSNFDHIEEERNYDYDDATTIATAVADAYQAGVITDAELRTIAEDLGPEGSAELAAQLALDPANTGVGGVVEAFGQQAEALGHEQAAAIAFSSSQELIAENLPTAADQRAAFEDVTAYLDSQDLDDLSNEQRAFFSIAAGNAVRPSANGNGWSDSELRDFVQDLGPSLAGEVVARTRNTPGDTAPGGAVEALGLATRDISRGDVSDEDREEWELNSAVALTASPELIDAHLNGTEALQAFQTLTNAASGQYGTAQDAQEEGYSLLRFPEILEGASALFEARTDEIVQAAITSGEGVLDQGHLDRFLQSTAFSPFSSPEVKQQVEAALTGWTEGHVQTSDSHDEGQLAFEVGQVLGIVQNAADAAVDRVGDDEAARVEAENETKAFITSLGSSIIGTALGAYNPLLGAIGGPVAQEILEAALPEGDVEAAREEAEAMFQRMLEEQGPGADLGQVLKEVQEAYYRRLQDAIGNQLQRDGLTEPERNRLEAAALVIGNIQEGIDDGYSAERRT